jgi:MFS family permease
MAALVAGAFLMGLGYGIPNPAASLLLSRVPSHRSMNSHLLDQADGVPIGGVVSGLLVPPLTLALGWQAALGICAALIAILALAIGHYRQSWDTAAIPARR